MSDTEYHYRTMADVRQANAEIGNHWFDRDTLRCFGCRVIDRLYGGRYFVTSERDSGYVGSDGVIHAAWDGKRRYSVRVAMPDGTIRTVGEFGQYASLSGAKRAAERLAGS